MPTGIEPKTSSLEEAPLTFEELYHRYYSMVRGVLFRLCGEGPLLDLLQECFIKVWRAMDRFENRSSVRTWIYRIAVNTAIDYLRRQRPTLVAYQEMADEVKSSSDDQRELVQKLLLLLSEDQRIVIILFYFEDLSLMEIGEALGIAEGTVKSRLHTARKNLEKHLAKLEDIK